MNTEGTLSGFQDFFPSTYHQGSAQYFKNNLPTVWCDPNEVVPRIYVKPSPQSPSPYFLAGNSLSWASSQAITGHVFLVIPHCNHFVFLHFQTVVVTFSFLPVISNFYPHFGYALMVMETLEMCIFSMKSWIHVHSNVARWGGTRDKCVFCCLHDVTCLSVNSPDCAASWRWRRRCSSTEISW